MRLNGVLQNESNNIIQAQNKSLKTRSLVLCFSPWLEFSGTLQQTAFKTNPLTRSQSHQKRKNSFYASFFCWLEFSETFQQMHEGKSGKSGRLVKPDYYGRFWKKKTEQNRIEREQNTGTVYVNMFDQVFLLKSIRLLLFRPLQRTVGKFR